MFDAFFNVTTKLRPLFFNLKTVLKFKGHNLRDTRFWKRFEGHGLGTQFKGHNVRGTILRGTKLSIDVRALSPAAKLHGTGNA